MSAKAEAYYMQGQQGGQVYSGLSTATGPFRQVVCLTSSTFGDFISSNLTNSSALNSIAFPAGTVIGGRTESFTLAGGLVIAYRE